MSLVDTAIEGDATPGKQLAIPASLRERTLPCADAIRQDGNT
jgi:hypothetical protein